MSRLWNKYIAWRYKVEMKTSCPDPLIVCPIWRDCSHVDGMLCNPKTCYERLKQIEEGEVRDIIICGPRG